MKINHKGFTIIEGLLLLVALTLIAFVGFYVYNANQNTNKVISQSPENITKTTNSQKFLTIKELGIKIPLSSKLIGLEYEINPADDAYAGLSTKAFEAAVGVCASPDAASSSYPAIVSVHKISGKYDKNNSQPAVYETYAVQFNDFYLTTSSPDGGYCDGSDQTKNDKVKAIFDRTAPALNEAVKNAKQI
ncbi:MAG TPA: hypothetical protein VLF79_03625 [Candidatus Saccharimonadales bacterium]|nr:hypothetical protein [Candidatus Saccharimonadales bacterium]